MGRVCAAGEGKKKPQRGGRLTICCTRILKRPFPGDFVRVSVLSNLPRPMLLRERRGGVGCLRVRKGRAGAPRCQGPLGVHPTLQGFDPSFRSERELTAGK